MAHFYYQIEFLGFDELEKALSSTQRVLSDMTEVMSQIGTVLVNGAARRISETNVSPLGIPWEPSQRVAEEGGKTLYDSGRLRLGLNAHAGPDYVQVGPDVIYGLVHQFGAEKGSFGRGKGKAGSSPWGHIPARPFLGVSAEEEETMVEIVSDALLEGFRHWIK